MLLCNTEQSVHNTVQRFPFSAAWVTHYCVNAKILHHFLLSSKVKYCIALLLVISWVPQAAWYIVTFSVHFTWLNWIVCFLSPSLLAYTEQYVEYDPFITPTDPSNPWISDDTTVWELEARCVFLDCLFDFLNFLSVLFYTGTSIVCGTSKCFVSCTAENHLLRDVR